MIYYTDSDPLANAPGRKAYDVPLDVIVRGNEAVNQWIRTTGAAPVPNVPVPEGDLFVVNDQNVRKANPPRPPGVPETAFWNSYWGKWIDEGNQLEFRPDGQQTKGIARIGDPKYSDEQILGIKATDRSKEIQEGINRLKGSGDFNQEDLGNIRGSREAQMRLMQDLAARSRGEGGPSLAEMALQRAQGDQMQQAAALLQNQRGAGQGSAAYNINAAQGAIAGRTASDAAMLRAKEQLDAQMALAGVANQARSSDLAQGGARAGLAANAAQSVQTAETQRQANEQSRQEYDQKLQMLLSQRDQLQQQLRQDASLSIEARNNISNQIIDVSKAIAALTSAAAPLINAASGGLTAIGSMGKNG